MVKTRLNSVLRQVRSLATRPYAQAPDAELLGAFVARRDEAAFEVLLRRHGPMVLRVARRVLGGEADAEDIFQATFLLLARKAGAIRRRASVASWLHGVAHRLALSARSRRARRRLKEGLAAGARPAEAPNESAWDELAEALHGAIEQLPEKYRIPLVHCYLEGQTQEEVARRLGAPLGTVRSWLARGRELLRRRLLRRGIALSAGGVSAALVASACANASAIPVPLMTSTLAAARQFAAGETIGSLVSAQVSTLVEKGMTAMVAAKLKSGAIWLLVAALAVGGSGFVARRGLIAKPEAPPAASAGDEQRKAGVPGKSARTDQHGDPLPPGALARLGTVRFRHERWLHDFAVSPDGRTVAAAAGKSVAFWDIATGRLTRRWTFSREDVHCLAFAPDGKSVAVGGEECVVHLFDLASGKESRRFVGHRPHRQQPGFALFGVAFTPDGQRLVSWASDKTVRVWETRSGKELSQMGEEVWVPWRLSPDGKLLAVRSEKGKDLRLWDMTANRLFRKLPLPAELGAVAFSPDGKTLAFSINEDDKFGTINTGVMPPCRIILWDIPSGKELGTLAGHRNWVLTLAFSPDGKRLVSGSQDRTMRLWDVDRRKEIHQAPALHTPFYPIIFSPDGNTLICRGVAENHIRLWDVKTWRERPSADGPHTSIGAVAYSPDGKLIASAALDKIWLWRADTGEVARILEGHTSWVSGLAFSADGKRLVSGSTDGTFRVWDPATGKEQRQIAPKGNRPERMAVSPDGTTLALWSWDNPRALLLCRADTEAKPRTIEVPSEEPQVIPTLNALCFSPDGKTLYASSGTHLSILRWDTATGKLLPPIGKHDGGLHHIALSPDGRSLAAVTMDGTLYLWETATGRRRLVSKDGGYATSVAFSPDGRRLALANTGNNVHWKGKDEVIPRIEYREQVRLVRAADGKVVRRFTGHIGGIACLSFSPDGRALASGGHDTTVLLWDVADARDAAGKEAAKLAPDKLAALWDGLRGTAADSYGCMNALLAAPAQAVQLLGEKLKPVVAVDAERFARLLKKLESDQFREREEATKELKELGDAAEPALRKALRENRALETKRRLRMLLDEQGGTDPVSGERLRSLRAVEVLEHIGDGHTRALLRRLSEGAAGAWLTEEAGATLRRLESRRRLR